MATKKAASKRLTRVPIMGQAARSGPGWTFAIELKSLTVDGVSIEPCEAANDLADILVWVIRQRPGTVAAMLEACDGNANREP